MSAQRHRPVVCVLLACSIGLLVPGIVMPVVTIRGVLTERASFG